MTTTITYRIVGCRRSVHQGLTRLFDHLTYVRLEGVELSAMRYRNGKQHTSAFDLYKELTKTRQGYRKGKGWAKYGVENQRSVLQRIHLAKQAFFRKLKNGEKAGLPRRNKRVRSFEGITRPTKSGAFYRLKIQGVGHLRFRDQRNVLDNPEYTFIRYRIVKHSLGSGYDVQLIVKDSSDKDEEPDDRDVIGIDFGWTHVATLSDGTHYPPPKRDDHRIRKLNRRLSRCKRGSKRRRKVKLSLRKEHQHVAVRRKNTTHRWTSDVVKNHSANLVLEDLKPERLTRKGGAYKKGFNRKGRSNAITMAKSMLIYKAERANGSAHLINPRNTTKECSDCGGHNALELSDRTYVCDHCDSVKDRDVNAAWTIRSRGLSAFAGRGSPLYAGPGGNKGGRPAEVHVTDIGSPTAQDDAGFTIQYKPLKKAIVRVYL